MYLKTLTLRGFKSFASVTTLHFEPGVTCVVGPNGSGKSNVVDALAWVMGEQGAKSLRGGKMEDVIFAGTSGRPPLGRAEVSLTIDNSDGALPIDYTEVTITRTLFRSGGSEYAINGSPCRLLDIQELLSDTGMGREMHVIVGQGQLDSVLRADPIGRRGFIEEAAGVLKHRRRKEKAERKLDATAGNIQRLTDLLAELRRQLGPLGRQAEVARKAATIQIDVRDARARLLADELVALDRLAADEQGNYVMVTTRRTQTEQQLGQLREHLAQLEAESLTDGPALARASDLCYRLTATRDRLRSLLQLATERRRHLSATPTHQGADPADLEQQAQRVRASRNELATEAAAAREHLVTMDKRRQETEAAARTAERELADLARLAADKREGRARLAGQVAAARSRVQAADDEIARLSTRLRETKERARIATREFTDLETQAADAETGEVTLDEAHDQASTALTAVNIALSAARTQATAAEKERAQWAARLEALELSAVPADGTAALLASDTADTLGSLASQLQVAPGSEAAIAAVLGSLADGVAVADISRAVDAIRYLRDDDAGRAAVLIGGASHEASLGQLPAGCRWAQADVTTDGALAGTLACLLAKVVIVPDLAVARTLLCEYPDLVTVTEAGDVLSALRAEGGSAAAPSSLHLQTAIDEARRHLEEAGARRQQLTFEIARLTAESADAQVIYDATLERLHESDAALAAVTQRLGHLGAVARSAEAEAGRIETSLQAATQARVAGSEKLESLTAALTALDDEPANWGEHIAAATRLRDEAAKAAMAARAGETDSRLAVRTLEERERSLAGRAESLERAANTERAALARVAALAAKRQQAAAEAGIVHSAATYALECIEPAIGAAQARRDTQQTATTARAGALAAARAQFDELNAEHERLVSAAHLEELARSQYLMRREGLQERSETELGINADELIQQFGPHLPVAVTEAGDPVVFVRQDQEKRLRRAERDLKVLGRVNPLALEEFAALEERHNYLAGQLTDLRDTRTDLLRLIGDIDDRVQTVFAQAFADTAAQFEVVFGQLFPGGQGRLVLTDPNDMLATGIEVEARPAGKKVKRLSLLSGGERALTAVALLIAIFKARPSPFYVMDEVEAALDDVNLTRLLGIFSSLRDDSQLIVVTHQKSTMEIADALYGVTMRSGVSAVISQRLRPRE